MGKRETGRKKAGAPGIPGIPEKAQDGGVIREG